MPQATIKRKQTRRKKSITTKKTLKYKQFIDEIGVAKQLQTYAMNRRPTMLIGEPGIGKTLLIRETVELLGLPLIQKLGGKFPVSRLVGQYHLKAKGQATTTEFEQGPLVKAMKTGAAFYLDEIDNLSEDIHDLLHPVLDHRRELSMADIGFTKPGHPSCIAAAPEFWFVSSCVEKSRLPNDFLDRFRVIRLQRLSLDSQLQKLTSMFDSISNVDLERLARIGELTRKVGWQKPSSFRQVVAAAQDIDDGIEIDEAIDNNLVNPNVEYDMDRISLRNAMEREGLGSTPILADSLVPEEKNAAPVFDLDSLPEDDDDLTMGDD